MATTGLVAAGAGDREWMIVERDGNLVTQREFPRLALVGSLQRATTRCGFRTAKQIPGTVPLAIPMVRERSAAIPVRVWNSHVRGHDEGDIAAAWLTQLSRAPKCAWCASTARCLAACNPEFAGDSGAHTMYADGYPFLVIGQASLDELNARLSARGGASLPMNRFRPNIVLEGLDAFAEDHIDTIETGGVILRREALRSLSGDDDGPGFDRGGRRRAAANAGRVPDGRTHGRRHVRHERHRDRRRGLRARARDVDKYRVSLLNRRYGVLHGRPTQSAPPTFP